MAIATPEPISTRIFINRANGSITKAPWKASPSAGDQISQMPASTMSATDRPVTIRVDVSPMNTPTINSTMAPMPSINSGVARARFGISIANSIVRRP